MFLNTVCEFKVNDEYLDCCLLMKLGFRFYLLFDEQDETTVINWKLDVNIISTIAKKEKKKSEWWLHDDPLLTPLLKKKTAKNFEIRFLINRKKSEIFASWRNVLFCYC